MTHDNPIELIDILQPYLYYTDLFDIIGGIMNRLDLVKALKDENGLSTKEARAIVDIFFDEMTNSLANGERVEIRGFCSFYIKKYKAYI